MNWMGVAVDKQTWLLQKIKWDQVLKNILKREKQNIFMPPKVAVFQAMSDSTFKKVTNLHLCQKDLNKVYKHLQTVLFSTPKVCLRQYSSKRLRGKQCTNKLHIAYCSCCIRRTIAASKKLAKASIIGRLEPTWLLKKRDQGKMKFQQKTAHALVD